MLMKMVSPCWRSSQNRRRSGSDNGTAGGEASICGGARGADGLPWCKDIGRHVFGEYSMAVVQANNMIEDACQLESGPICGAAGDFGAQYGTFVGVYDGHGGAEAARFVADNLFQYLTNFTTKQNGISAEVICQAFAATEENFIALVRAKWEEKPQLASVGSCCLVGIISGGILYVANAGDSRAVLGRVERGIREATAVQLSMEHNASNEYVRQELRSLHPSDPQIVALKHNVWRVKGLIQISRSIGDAYLKDKEFNREPLLPKFRLEQPFNDPILSAEPSILIHKLTTEDQFIIFASDGLWENVSNQEAVDIVHSSPRNGIARKLAKTALQTAAKKREMRYSDLKRISPGVRRHFHDDITVIVLYLDPELSCKNLYHGPVISVRGGVPPLQPQRP